MVIGMARKPPVPKEVLKEHTKQIRASTRKLERRRQEAAAAEDERDEAILAAFEAGLTADPIHEAANMSKDRAWQINQRRR
jgi:hypothetical protein